MAKKKPTKKIRYSIKNCRKGKGCSTTSEELMITTIKVAA